MNTLHFKKDLPSSRWVFAILFLAAPLGADDTTPAPTSTPVPVSSPAPAPAAPSTPVSAAAESAASHYQSGLAYERLGRLEAAYSQLQLACALDAKDSRMALALGVVALRLKRDDVAQRSLERSITLDANSAASYYQLALLYEKQKAWDRAIDSWNRFVELNPDELLKLEARKHIHYLETQKS